MKILVTGGEGFIGTYVCEILSGYADVLSIDCHSDYNGLIPKDELSWLLTQREKRNGAFFSLCDIRDKGKLATEIARFNPTHVLHLAAYPRAKVVDKNPSMASETLINGLLNILECCENIDHFIYVSSSMVYGDFDKSISEDDPCNPKGTYGILKLTGESLVKNWAKQQNKVYTILRPSAVYGPLDVKDRVVSKFFQAAFKDEVLMVHGENERLDFTYVEDLVDGICSVFGNKNSYNETFNMSKGQSNTILHAAHTIVRLVGSGRIEIVNPHKLYPSRESLNCSKAGTLLGFNPTTTIDKGFGIYYDWILQNPLFRN